MPTVSIIILVCVPQIAVMMTELGTAERIQWTMFTEHANSRNAPMQTNEKSRDSLLDSPWNQPAKEWMGWRTLAVERLTNFFSINHHQCARLSVSELDRVIALIALHLHRLWTLHNKYARETCIGSCNDYFNERLVVKASKNKWEYEKTIQSEQIEWNQLDVANWPRRQGE